MTRRARRNRRRRPRRPAPTPRRDHQHATTITGYLARAEPSGMLHIACHGCPGVICGLPAINAPGTALDCVVCHDLDNHDQPCTTCGASA